jgi:hypothetical protein
MFFLFLLFVVLSIISHFFARTLLVFMLLCCVSSLQVREEFRRMYPSRNDICGEWLRVSPRF